jgi:hypothetical protein
MSSNNEQVVYAVRVERLSYADLQVLLVKIGRTNDIDRRVSQYKTTHPAIDVLDVWAPNPELSVEKCEDGVHNLAEKYAYERDGELFTFLQDSYDDFADTTAKLLRPQSQTPKSPTTPPGEVENTPTLGSYIVEFEDDGNSIKQVSGDNQTEAMVKATNYLVNTHDLTEQITIPWVPARKKAIINDTRTWDEADPAYKSLDNGHFVDTKINSSGKQREMKRMATKCGVDISFRGDW